MQNVPSLFQNYTYIRNLIEKKIFCLYFSLKEITDLYKWTPSIYSIIL